MANQSLFQSLRGKLLRHADAVNEEFAPAYAFTPRQALAQYATTGCLNQTFYFPRVIDNGKMLRNFVQIMRSGVTGRKSLGSLPKRLIGDWLERQSEAYLFEATVGQKPSLADVIKMVHPKPRSASREALYGYLIGRPHDAEALPKIVRDFESFKSNPTAEVPEVPFQLLTALNLGQREWVEIARRASWQMTRMNLNTFARHGVFAEKGMTELIANRLRDPQVIRRAKVFP